MTTELERARKHLRWAQDFFHRRRSMGIGGQALNEAKEILFAALSWVWDAQECEGRKTPLMATDLVGVDVWEGWTIRP
jgi:hypothetical protein